jgi:hypothetical protein
MLASPTKELLEHIDNLVIIILTPTVYDQQAKVVINDSPARIMKLLLEEPDSRNK